MKNALHNPLPASLSSECKKAAAIIESFINPRLKIDGEIPRKIFQGAKGIAIYTAFRVGFLGSVRFGSGLIVARLPDGSWSAPSAMAMGGIGAGGQFGAELTDFIFVLTTDAAVRTFTQSGTLTLSGNISMAVGPVGRSAEASGVVGVKSSTGVFTYSKTRGLYGGLTVEGGVLAERAAANKKMYGRRIRATELLNGLIPSPPEAEVLMAVLNGDFFQFDPSVQSTEDPAQTPGQSTGASVQSPAEQPQQVAASSSATAATGPGAEETPEGTESSAGVIHDAREPSRPETAASTDQRIPAAELESEHAPGNTENPSEDTQDVTGSNIQETVPTAEQGPATELPAKSAPEPVESITESPHNSSHESTTQHVSPDSQNTEQDQKQETQVKESTNDAMTHELKTQQPEPVTERVLSSDLGTSSK
ncbi:uncharacterized protein N7529_003127 [Penicillium soppii]|uniref:uncharacterized protein n=1 Tax=Penicillium soppii TaxID=69789 RepID=UPI002546EE82|nr:uncharacterized protein N7529_003127 [Penicillium soppii]KAJ5874697.1 hypothetical protein N7529_003127 [Penicillium soppii]